MSKQKPKPQADKQDAAAAKRKRNVIFISLDDPTEDALQRFLSSQRVAPDRAAVAFTALIEFLSREGFKPSQS